MPGVDVGIGHSSAVMIGMPLYNLMDLRLMRCNAAFILTVEQWPRSLPSRKYWVFVWPIGVLCI